MRTHGSTIVFQPQPWEEIYTFLSKMADRHPQFAHMAAIADSVMASGAAGQLAGTTSMHDILVVTAPPPDPPYDLIAVRAPGSLRQPLPGQVIIEHRSCTGHDDCIERPVADAVRLFWRFVIYKVRHPPQPADYAIARTGFGTKRLVVQIQSPPSPVRGGIERVPKTAFGQEMSGLTRKR
jgi:hypothetical protein